MTLVKPHGYYGRTTLKDIDWESGPDRKLCHNTYRITLNDHPVVRFHNTYIVISSGNGCYRLNSGGWQTSTTKQRINALMWNLGIQVYQRNFEWFVSTPDGERIWEDNMLVIASGWEGCY